MNLRSFYIKSRKRNRNKKGKGWDSIILLNFKNENINKDNTSIEFYNNEYTLNLNKIDSINIYTKKPNLYKDIENQISFKQNSFGHNEIFVTYYVDDEYNGYENGYMLNLKGIICNTDKFNPQTIYSILPESLKDKLYII
jgi:hypothetical protein